LVCGFDDGSVKFYDFLFKINAWFEKLGIDCVKSISFSNLPPEKVEQVKIEGLSSSKDTKEDPPFMCSPFIVADSMAKIINNRA
jgi:hypothetical protein